MHSITKYNYLIGVEKMSTETGDGLHISCVQYKNFLIEGDGLIRIVQHVMNSSNT